MAGGDGASTLLARDLVLREGAVPVELSGVPGG